MFLATFCTEKYIYCIIKLVAFVTINLRKLLHNKEMLVAIDFVTNAVFILEIGAI